MPEAPYWESWMERHRGKRGLFGWIVLRLDVWYLRRFAAMLIRLKQK